MNSVGCTPFNPLVDNLIRPDSSVECRILAGSGMPGALLHLLSSLQTDQHRCAAAGHLPGTRSFLGGAFSATDTSNSCVSSSHAGSNQPGKVRPRSLDETTTVLG
jgi:hypothetical protein